jgi:hypothetical protein
MLDLESPVGRGRDSSKSIVASRSNKPLEQNSIRLAANPVAFALEARFETAATDPRDRRKGELGAYLYYFSSLGRRKLSLSVGLVLSFVFFSSFPRQSLLHIPSRGRTDADSVWNCRNMARVVDGVQR